MIPLLLAGCDFVRGYAEGHAPELVSPDPAVPLGLQRFLFDDFRGLSTDTMQRAALPWKLTGAALLVSKGEELSVTSLNALLEREYGLLVPDRVGNWPEGAAQPTFDRPMGVVWGTVARSIPPVELEAANTGCSICHSSLLHDAAGDPTRTVWVGLPSSSFHLERFSVDVYEAFLLARDQPERVMAAVDAVYPAISARERHTLEQLALPALSKLVTERQERYGRFTPYSNGGPGLTNGAATIQLYMGLIGDLGEYPEQVGYTTVPTLGGIGLRRSVLCDGVYAPPGAEHFGPQDVGPDEAGRQALAGLAAMVTLSTLGVEPSVAVENQDRMRDVVDWLLDDYRTPPFPAPVDAEKALAGASVFAARCAECHGTYAEDGALVSFPNRVSPLADIGTDPQRMLLVTAEAMATLSASPLGAVLEPVAPTGYVAQPLTGVWATAPYLHNGSVPTVWHLLHPEQRPVAFESGGHKLDHAKLGLAGDVDADGVLRYPAGYVPWTRPEVYDTREPGRSNRGHEATFAALSEDEKDQVLEYLKRL